MIPDLDLARAHKWVKSLNDEMPSHARDQVRYELDVSDRALTVVERRPLWNGDSTDEWTSLFVCRFRYTKSRRQWSLYWRDRNSEFHLFKPVAPTPHLSQLIDAVLDDTTGIFWG